MRGKVAYTAWKKPLVWAWHIVGAQQLLVALPALELYNQLNGLPIFSPVKPPEWRLNCQLGDTLFQERSFHFESLMTKRAASTSLQNMSHRWDDWMHGNWTMDPHSYKRLFHSQKAKYIKFSITIVVFDSPWQYFIAFWTEFHSFILQLNIWVTGWSPVSGR